MPWPTNRTPRSGRAVAESITAFPHQADVRSLANAAAERLRIRAVSSLGRRAMGAIARFAAGTIAAGGGSDLRGRGRREEKRGEGDGDGDGNGNGDGKRASGGKGGGHDGRVIRANGAKAFRESTGHLV